MRLKLFCVVIAFLIFAPYSYAAKEQKNYVFRHYLYQFFNDPAFQLEHVKFPLEHSYVDDEFEEFHKVIAKAEWKHLPGPEHYRCESGCFDIVIYDNFEKKYANYDKRVLSFEGVENGISSSMYFEYLDGQWMLVKWEDFSN